MTDETIKQNPLGMKSLAETNALNIAENIKQSIFKLDWIFDKGYEKIILVIMATWSAYSFWRICLS